ncbi:MarR family transcriptional regulator [Actinorhabdospora filicis]|uniref:MarR family transcriptional regulator n=1 Tax=Actinorhabdospora filicis TaxID=1785913 RepID=A0A9W6SM77_9ACTN|nr:MarR family winged helix-turn-helix transcriptional regulator [Actinorhabdospora filicis]GLZ78391.1 MarR family transcriptional regulator [Actinorhabdospora filicis]
MGNGIDDGDRAVWDAFFAMQMDFWRHLSRILQTETGLSEPDYAILLALRDAPGGRLRAYQLSEVTDFEKSRLHHHLRRMSVRGLLTRESEADDPRAAVAAITPEGTAAITAAVPKREEHIRRWLLDALDDGQKAALTDISEAVLRGLKDKTASAE